MRGRKLRCSISRFDWRKILKNSSCIRLSNCSLHCVNAFSKISRSSVVLAGAILGRFKTATFSYPGGCDIGTRPIDLHLKGFQKLGVKIEESSGFIKCYADKIIGNDIHLDFPSVGATENIILAAVLAEGETVITNAAMEPEIIDLQDFLNKMVILPAIVLAAV